MREGIIKWFGAVPRRWKIYLPNFLPTYEGHNLASIMMLAQLLPKSLAVEDSCYRCGKTFNIRTGQVREEKEAGQTFVCPDCCK